MTGSDEETLPREQAGWDRIVEGLEMDYQPTRLCQHHPVRVGDIVYGLKFELSDLDEEFLDLSEGVPISYAKETLPIEFTSVTILEGSDPIAGTVALRDATQHGPRPIRATVVPSRSVDPIDVAYPMTVSIPISKLSFP
ncbi:hypothetical protein DFP72DRAFT_840936 [Ephemerocybe angulata]|uniref:Uncharacterized protein n=1 Tax=Ephemerocybe angulata TaxID=980116 RepID=A0A8H6IG60_9AGAR|nr:hypothetical protein DFP72DRAFT_840936 [Tulosesus angulatus]